MKRAVHTLLLGDQAAATKRLPFAQAKLQAMFAELGNGRRHIVRHFIIEGDSIDLWVDSRGGRIQITSAAVAGNLREYGSGGDFVWKLFSDVGFQEATTGRVTLSDVADTTAYFPEDVSARGFLAFQNTIIESVVDSSLVMHGPTGARLWTFEDFVPRVANVNEPLPALLFGATGSCLVSDFAVFCDGQNSANQMVYEDYPDGFLGEQFTASTLQYVRLDVADGGNVTTAETKTAVIWGAPEAVFVPFRLASCAPLFDAFHALGRLLAEGTDEEDDRLVFDTWELHHVDAETLTLLHSVVIPDGDLALSGLDVVADDAGTVYVGYLDFSSTSRYEAYSRELARTPEKDFLDIPAECVTPFDRHTVAIVGDHLYSRLDPAGVPTIKKIDRSGAVIAERSIFAGILSGEVTALFQIRNSTP